MRSFLSIILTLTLLIPSAVISSARAAPTSDSAPARITHIVLTSDLDSAKQVRDLEAAIAQARTDRCRVVLLETSLNRARPDLLLSLAQSITAARQPAADSPPLKFIAYLTSDHDQPLTSPCITLALFCDVTAISPKARLLCRSCDYLPIPPSPDSRSGSSSDPPAASQAALSQLTAQLDIALTRLERSRDWLKLFPTLTAPAWLIQGDPWTTRADTPSTQPSANLSFDPPPADPLFPTTLICGPLTAAPLNLELTLTPRDALSLRLACATASSPTTALTAANTLGSISRRLVIDSKLSSSRTTLHDQITKLDEELRRLDTQLRDAARLRSDDTLPKRRRVGRESLHRIDLAQKTLADSENILDNFPELLAEVPPGKTPVAQDPQLTPRLWRNTLQDFRDQLADFKARAESLRDTQPN